MVPVAQTQNRKAAPSTKTAPKTTPGVAGHQVHPVSGINATYGNQALLRRSRAERKGAQPASAATASGVQSAALPRGVASKASGKDDRAEREAERGSQSLLSGSLPSAGGITPLAGPAGASANPSAPAGMNRHDLSSGGEALPDHLRSFFQGRLGVESLDVRIHRGPAAARANAALNSDAFAFGNHIWFRDENALSDLPLLAHELVHVSQQEGVQADQWRIQRKERPPGLSLVKIIAIAGDRNAAQGVLSDGKTILPIKLTENTFPPSAPGKPYRLTLIGPTAPTQEAPYAMQEGLIRFIKPNDIQWADEVDLVVLDADPAAMRASINALPKDIQDYLTTDEGPAGTWEDLRNVVNTGILLQTQGVTSEELTLWEHTGIVDDSVDTVGATAEFLVERNEKIAGASDNRAALVQAADELRKMDPVSVKYFLSHKGSLNSLVFDRTGNANFSESDFLQSYRVFAKAFDVELRGLAEGILNSTEVALLRTDAAFVGVWQPQYKSPATLQGEIAKINADADVRKARQKRDRNEAPPAPPPAKPVVKPPELTPQDIVEAVVPVNKLNAYFDEQQARDERLEKLTQQVNETVSQKSRLKIGSMQGFNIETILSAPTAEAAWFQLENFVIDGRTKVQHGRRLIEGDRRVIYSADKVIDIEKQLLSVTKGDILDQVIDEIARDEQSKTTLWEDIWQILKIVVGFLEGPWGLVLQAAVAAAEISSETKGFGQKRNLSQVGLATAPNAGELLQSIFFTASGVGITAALTPWAKVAGKGGIGRLGGEIGAGGERVGATVATGEVNATTGAGETVTTHSADPVPVNPTQAETETANAQKELQSGEQNVVKDAAATSPGPSAQELRTARAKKPKLEERRAELTREQKLTDHAIADREQDIEEGIPPKRGERTHEDRLKDLNKKSDKLKTEIQENKRELAEIEKIESEYKGSKPWRTRVLTDQNEIGLASELETTIALQQAGWTPQGKTFGPDQIRLPEDFDAAVERYRSRGGIDGYYTRTGPNGETERLVVESKGTGKAGAPDPTGRGDLRMNKDDILQSSRRWLSDRFGKMGVSETEREALDTLLKENRLTVVYSVTDPVRGTQFFKIHFIGETDANIGGVFDPFKPLDPFHPTK